MNARYGSHHACAEARNWLNSDDSRMKKDESLSDYLGRFSTKTSAYQQNILDVIADFKARLTRPYQYAVVGFNPTSWDEFVERLRLVESDIQYTALNNRNDNSGNNNAANNSNGGTGRGNSRGGARGRGRGGMGRGAAALNADKPPFNRTWAQIDGLRALGRCFKCGEIGHSAFYHAAPCANTNQERSLRDIPECAHLVDSNAGRGRGGGGWGQQNNSGFGRGVAPRGGFNNSHSGFNSTQVHAANAIPDHEHITDVSENA